MTDSSKFFLQTRKLIVLHYTISRRLSVLGVGVEDGLSNMISFSENVLSFVQTIDKGSSFVTITWFFKRVSGLKLILFAYVHIFVVRKQFQTFSAQNLSSAPAPTLLCLSL